MTKPTPNLIPFSKLAPHVQTGDIILMHGDAPGSFLIELAEDSIWSHSGMIVRSKDINLKGKGIPELTFWESNTIDNLPDLILKKGKFGPMIVDLVQRLKTNVTDYKEMKMIYIKVNIPRTPAMFKLLENFIPTVHHAGFPSEFQMAVSAFEGRVFKKQSSLNNIFCSELVAGSMETMGWIDHTWPWNAYEPGDFVKKGKVTFELGGWLSSPIPFDPSK